MNVTDVLTGAMFLPCAVAICAIAWRGYKAHEAEIDEDYYKGLDENFEEGDLVFSLDWSGIVPIFILLFTVAILIVTCGLCQMGAEKIMSFLH